MVEVNFPNIKDVKIDLRADIMNKAARGTFSEHLAAELFEKIFYYRLKDQYGAKIYKLSEFIEDIYQKNPRHITEEQKESVFESLTAFFVINSSDAFVENIFEEKQNDTADILFCDKNFYNIIDVKTRNISKTAQAPNIISALKLAKMCALMLDNNEFDTIEIDYIGIDWQEEGNRLKCIDVHHCSLFKANPEELYINWAAGMQIQFHVSDLNQDWQGTRKEWAVEYLRAFVKSAEARCDKMREDYIEPFLKYIQ